MRWALTLLCGLTLVVAACGGDAGDGASDATTATDTETDQTAAPDTQPESTDSEGSSDQGSTQGLPPGGTGTVTVDSETLEVQWVGNCIIDEVFDPHPDDLDLVAATEGGLDAMFIEVSFEELSDGMLMRFIPELQRQHEDGSYSSYEPEGQYMQAPDGNWYQDIDGGLYVALFSGQPHENPAVEAPVLVESGRVSGSLPMTSDSGTVNVSFDLTYVEAIDCSL